MRKSHKKLLTTSRNDNNRGCETRVTWRLGKNSETFESMRNNWWRQERSKINQKLSPCQCCVIISFLIKCFRSQSFVVLFCCLSFRFMADDCTIFDLKSFKIAIGCMLGCSRNDLRLFLTYIASLAVGRGRPASENGVVSTFSTARNKYALSKSQVTTLSSEFSVMCS